MMLEDVEEFQDLASLALPIDGASELGAEYLKIYAEMAPVDDSKRPEVLSLDDWPEMRPVAWGRGGLDARLNHACRAADKRVRAICEEHAQSSVGRPRATPSEGRRARLRATRATP